LSASGHGLSAKKHDLSAKIRNLSAERHDLPVLLIDCPLFLSDNTADQQLGTIAFFSTNGFLFAPDKIATLQRVNFVICKITACVQRKSVEIHLVRGLNLRDDDF